MLEQPTQPENAETGSEAAPAGIEHKARVCPECSGEFEPPTKGPGQHKRFCKAECRVAWSNREKSQGAALITRAKIWRAHRGAGEHGKAAWGQMTAILDILIDDDRAAGRKSLKSKELEPFVRATLRDAYLDLRR